MNFENLLHLNMSTGLAVAMPLAVAGGVLSAFNPCCLPMLPSVVLLLSQKSLKSRWAGFFIAAFFVVGFASSMALMGALTTGFGFVFGQLGSTFLYAVAAVLFAMALNLIGVYSINLPALNAEKIANLHGGAFFVGAAFTFVVAPCSTPILVSLLAFSASTKSVLAGALLLFLYGLGAGIPLIVMGSFMHWLGIFDYVQSHRKALNRLTAGLLVGVGLYLIWSA